MSSVHPLEFSRFLKHRLRAVYQGARARYRAVVLGGCVLLLVLATAPPARTQGGEQPYQAEVSAAEAPAHIAVVDGAATVERDGRSQQASANLPFVPGDRLRTAAGRIELLLPDGSVLDVDQYSSIDLQAATYVVSAHGALLLMDTPLIPGQNVRIFNEMTAESAECSVTSLREKRERRFVGITFTSPNIDFWHIVFPKAGTRQAVRSPQTGALVPPGFHPDDTQL